MGMLPVPTVSATKHHGSVLFVTVVTRGADAADSDGSAPVFTTVRNLLSSVARVGLTCSNRGSAGLGQACYFRAVFR